MDYVNLSVRNSSIHSSQFSLISISRQDEELYKIIGNLLAEHSLSDGNQAEQCFFSSTKIDGSKCDHVDILLNSKAKFSVIGLILLLIDENSVEKETQ